jgi:hypothetical protein
MKKNWTFGLKNQDLGRSKPPPLGPAPMVWFPKGVDEPIADYIKQDITQLKDAYNELDTAGGFVRHKSDGYPTERDRRDLMLKIRRTIEPLERGNVAEGFRVGRHGYDVIEAKKDAILNDVYEMMSYSQKEFIKKQERDTALATALEKERAEQAEKFWWLPGGIGFAEYIKKNPIDHRDELNRDWQKGRRGKTRIQREELSDEEEERSPIKKRRL